MKTLRLFAVCFLMFCQLSVVQAVDFDVSNTSLIVQGAETISGSNTVKRIAQKFGSDSLVSPTSVWMAQLSLSSFSSFNISNLDVQIYTNVSNLPGTPIGSLLGSGTSVTSGGIYDFTNLDSPIVLTANTDYWLVIGNKVAGTGSNNINWAYANSSTPTIGTNGKIYSVSAVNTGSVWNTFPTNPQLMRITNVPEPSTYLLGLISSVAMSLTTYRRLKINCM